MPNRKLNKATDQRDAMLRNMVTAFLWNGKLVTTESRAKEVRPIAEKLITLAVSEYKNTETVTKTKIETNDKDFDVDFHEAIAMVPGMGDDKKGKILDCVQTGYKLNDKVIRHAKVAVGQ